jgi:hypothetical protein
MENMLEKKHKHNGIFNNYEQQNEEDVEKKKSVMELLVMINNKMT